MSDYGQKTNHNSGGGEMYLPGSPDARAKGGDMYDSMTPISGYGKKVETKKNKTGSGPTNTGIQGSKARGNSKQTESVSEPMSGTGKKGSSSYGTKVGNQLDNSPTATDAFDYGLGRYVKGEKRKHLKEQEA